MGPALFYDIVQNCEQSMIPLDFVDFLGNSIIQERFLYIFNMRERRTP